MKQYKSELVTVPEWDGDTEDDIWRAIQLLRAILDQIQTRHNETRHHCNSFASPCSSMGIAAP